MIQQKIAVIGANGFVGSEIAKAIKKTDSYELIPFFRESPINLLDTADIIIHSGNPAKRFGAENHPIEDFKETVEKTAKFFKYTKGKRFILISSISCRTQLYTHYGRHRRACELIVDFDKSLVVRLGPMFGGSRKQDMLHDLIFNRDVYIAEDSKYAYVDVSWVGKQIVKMIKDGEYGIKEIGAKNHIRLGDLKEYLGSTSKFLGRVESQEPENFTEGPDVNSIYTYIEQEKHRKE